MTTEEMTIAALKTRPISKQQIVTPIGPYDFSLEFRNYVKYGRMA